MRERGVYRNKLGNIVGKEIGKKRERESVYMNEKKMKARDGCQRITYMLYLHFFLLSTFYLYVEANLRIRSTILQVQRNENLFVEQLNIHVCIYIGTMGIINYRVEGWPWQLPWANFNYRFDEIYPRRDSIPHTLFFSQFQRTDSFRSGFLSRVRKRAAPLWKIQEVDNFPFNFNLFFPYLCFAIFFLLSFDFNFVLKSRFYTYLEAVY